MTTATHSASPTSSALPRWARLAGWQFGGYALILGGFLLAAVVIAAVVMAVIARNTTPTLSAMQFAQQAAPWFVFGVAIHYAVSWLGPHVAAGLTRRSFVKAAVTAVVAAAAFAAVALVVVQHLERWIYGLFGWHAGPDPGRVLATGAPLPSYLWGLFLLFTVAGLTGLIVGLTYARLGWLATFLLPLTFSPLIAASLLAFNQATMFVPARIRIDGGNVTMLGSAGAGPAVIGPLIAAAAVLAIYLLARRIPIHSPRA